MKVNIIILNYNGRDLLKKYLPSVIDAAKKSKHNCIVTVLDNKSTDDSVQLLKNEFPEINIYIAKENKVYCSFNKIAETINDDIIVLLNNDIKTEQDFIDPLIGHFLDNPDVFFVATHGDRAIAKTRWG
ncbi:MAG: glycosyltransferase, partial [Candidatus Omnitrophica bacterium]|nr:glycosyltransferase [Candidatus Omnitrophota bacterium]